MPAYLTAALYHFAELPDFAALQAPLRAVCEQGGVKGTLLLALEGVNGTIAGPEAGVRSVLAHLRADPRLTKLVHKESWSDKAPFHRLKVKLKKEIVTLGVPEVVPSRLAGTYVKPADWNALITDPEVLVVDTRNDYEVAIGSFEGAVDPDIKTFTELKDWVREHTNAPGVLDGKRKVAMFCTGGIRCEKSTAFLRLQGFDEVYHLEGGILKYLEEVPPEQSLWQGECFVFDERVSVGHGLRPGPFEPCRSCRWPLSPDDKASRLYVRGVSCPRCHDQRTPEEKVRLAERQRQVELAEARGERHVGATMPQPD